MKAAMKAGIGYVFKNKALLEQALTHPSATEGLERRQGSQSFCNQRLEFLGDSVLGMVVAKYLYDNLPNKPEGVLTKLRAKLVCEDALYGYAKKINLGELLVMGKGEENSGGRDRKSTLSDAFEAVIAAIYLDSGLESAAAFVTPFLPSAKTLSSGKLITGDYKTALQEIVQQNPNASIYYNEVGEKGAAHDKRFFASVCINGELRGEGMGKTKKESQQMAAKAALAAMGYDT